MRRAVLIGTLAAAVLLAGCLDGGQQPDAGSSSGGTAADGEPGDTHVVQYTASGFSPASLTIDQGDTVRWESDGTAMWVAVDVHPTHGQWDGTTTNEHCPNDGDVFDQCKTGNTYSFTFDETGSWSYHNHRSAAHTGTITVQ